MMRFKFPTFPDIQADPHQILSFQLARYTTQVPLDAFEM